MQTAPPKTSRVPGRARVELMGLAIDDVRERDVIDFIVSSARDGKGGCVVTPNLDHLRTFCVDPSVRPIFERAELVVVDGTTLVWASRLQGTPLPERIPGSALIYSLTEAAAHAGLSVYLLGGNPGAGERAAVVLRARSPGLRIAGISCPPMGFEKSDEGLQAVEDALRTASPHLVYTCLGFPKQEWLNLRLRERFPAMWFLGLGISLSFVAGDLKRAPPLVQRLGLEWMHRTLQEPRRLFRRYVVNGLPFSARMFASALEARMRGAPRAGNRRCTARSSIDPKK